MIYTLLVFGTAFIWVAVALLAFLSGRDRSIE
jgi:hypothetical protein